MEKQYVELLASYSIERSSHITNSISQLKKEIADLVNKHKIYLALKT